jgi:hypothetical protein
VTLGCLCQKLADLRFSKLIRGALSTPAPAYEALKSGSFGGECITGVTCCPKIGNEGCNVALDEIVGSRMNGARALDFHQVIFLSPATAAGEVRSPELCRVGNHRIPQFSKKREGSKLPRGIILQSA